MSDVAGPVKSINPLFVPPFAPGSIPVTPVVNGRPVTFVITPLAGVPRAGATNVLFDIVTAFVLKTNSSATEAKSGIVSVVPPTV